MCFPFAPEIGPRRSQGLPGHTDGRGAERANDCIGTRIAGQVGPGALGPGASACPTDFPGSRPTSTELRATQGVRRSTMSVVV